LRRSIPATIASAHSWTEVVAFSGQGNLSNASSKLLMSLRCSRTRSVSIQPGCTEPTSTPLWASSSRRQFANCSTAALEAAYGAMPGAIVNAAVEETIIT
jgi:hypothetical protein